MNPSASAVSSYIETLWRLVYNHLRSRGCSLDEAEELTQETFERVASRNLTNWIERGAGGEDELKIRNYLFVVARNLRCDRKVRAAALKRGGDVLHLSVDDEHVAQRFHPRTATTPADELEWREAREHWDRHLAALAKVAGQRGQRELFECLRDSLEPDFGHADYEKAARNLGLKPRNVRVQANHWRKQLLARARLTLEPGQAA